MKANNLAEWSHKIIKKTLKFLLDKIEELDSIKDDGEKSINWKKQMNLVIRWNRIQHTY